MTSGKEMDSHGEVNVPADNRGMARRHSRGWTILNCNLMAHGKFREHLLIVEISPFTRSDKRCSQDVTCWRRQP
jgi:hypothetical protein